MRRILPLAAVATASTLFAAAPALADQVIPDDLIAQGSICSGFDCIDGESFGFDTLRLKENNTRIKFDDTSVSPGFAANDWALQANDRPVNGANRFLLMDDTSGRVPLSVYAGAPNDALVVGSGGNVGLGAGTPAAPLHVWRADGTASVRVEETTGATEPRVLAELVNNGPARLRLANSAAGATAWLVGGAGATDFSIGAGGQGVASLTLTPGGEVRAGTVLSQAADPAAATAAAPADPAAILAALRTLPLSTSSYAADPDARRHLWPAASDFHAAFGLGAADGTVAPGDMAGVALAAVQAIDAAGPAGPAGPGGPAGAAGVAGVAGPGASTKRIGKLERRNKKLAKRLRVLEKRVRSLAKG
jgi:hypothetical protein